MVEVAVRQHFPLVPCACTALHYTINNTVNTETILTRAVVFRFKSLDYTVDLPRYMSDYTLAVRAAGDQANAHLILI